MQSDASPPVRPPRPRPGLFGGARAPFAWQYRIVWWVAVLLPTITVGLELAGLLKIGNHPLLTPINTLIVSSVVCTAASYSQRRDVSAILMDLMLVMLLVLIQVTLIAKLAGYLAGSPGLFG